jgi:nodulation protein E
VTRRVAVTGAGAVTPIGGTAAAFWQGMLEGRCGIGPITTIATDRLSARIAAEIRGHDPAAHFERRRLPLLDRTTQLALLAAREAMAASGLAIADPTRAGAILGASVGQETYDSGYLALYGENAARLPPLTVPRLMPSAPASQVSMEFRLQGPGYAVASACASAAHAIGQAGALIRGGLLDAAIAGGSDAPIVVGTIKGWESLRVLSPDGCRPFSRDRNGLVLGEGAGMLVLEEWESARARGAPILAELAGFGMSADAGDITAPDAQGAARAITACLRDASLPATAIGYVNAHGTGTRLNDRTEVAALRRALGEALPPVSSTKSMIGHAMAACGAVEAVATVLALHHQVLPPTLGWREPDPECAIDCVPDAAREARFAAALSNSFAFGGLNAVLAFRRA